MSYLEFYSYRQLEPYPHLYPDQYHLRHLENAGWERRFVDSLAEKKSGGTKEKGASKSCGPTWRVANPSLVLRGTTAWTPNTPRLGRARLGRGPGINPSVYIYINAA